MVALDARSGKAREMVFPRRSKGLKQEVTETCTVTDYQDDPLPDGTLPPPAAEPEPPRRAP